MKHQSVGRHNLRSRNISFQVRFALILCMTGSLSGCGYLLCSALNSHQDNVQTCTNTWYDYDAGPSCVESASVFGKAGEGNAECLSNALDNGASVEDVDANGFTLLMYASQQNQMHRSTSRYVSPTLELLIKRGAKVNRTNTDGISAVFVAVSMKAYVNVDYLLKHGADINAQSTTGVTPMILAAWGWDLSKDLQDWFISHGADPNQTVTMDTCIEGDYTQLKIYYANHGPSGCKDGVVLKAGSSANNLIRSRHPTAQQGAPADRFASASLRQNGG